jgi:hypothetical protein
MRRSSAGCGEVQTGYGVAQTVCGVAQKGAALYECDGLNVFNRKYQINK